MCGWRRSWLAHQGIDEYKSELVEILDFLKDPRKYAEIGATLPKGVLLSGPPGCGKTMLAKAIAKESNATFIYADGSAFDQMFVGFGAHRIKVMFEEARRYEPCIIFIDEIDAIAGKRSTYHRYFRQAMNQLLTHMDGFVPSSRLLVIGATNLVESLDPAILRPGRFDKIVEIPYPSLKARTQILNHYIQNLNHSISKQAIREIASQTAQFTGAHLMNLVKESAFNAIRENSNSVSSANLETSLDRMTLGLKAPIPEEPNWDSKKPVESDSKIKDPQIPSKSSDKPSETSFESEEAQPKIEIVEQPISLGSNPKSIAFLQKVAFHEAGHALTAILNGEVMKLRKISIVPRGSAGGVNHFFPTKEYSLYEKEKWLKLIQVMMGGRVAEEIYLGRDEITAGCGSDLNQATNIALEMVQEYGMYGIGMVGDPEEMGDKKRRKVEETVETIMRQELENTKNILKDNWKYVEVLATELLKENIMERNQVVHILRKAGLNV